MENVLTENKKNVSLAEQARDNAEKQLDSIKLENQNVEKSKQDLELMTQNLEIEWKKYKNSLDENAKLKEQLEK